MGNQAEKTWRIAMEHAAQGLEEWSKGWRAKNPNGPSDHVMQQTVAFLRRMPLPQVKEPTP